jgi:pyrroloquinoline quinone biosynthesis protein B
VAVSADGARWFLLGVSPDVRTQIESFASLLPTRKVRGTAIEGLLLANGDLDHVLGLLQLREGEPLVVHTTHWVRRLLTDGLGLTATLTRYCGLAWREAPAEPVPLCYRDGSPSGLSYATVPVPGKPPRYCGRSTVATLGPCVGYRVIDDRTGAQLVFVPSLAFLDDALAAELDGCDCLLLDGTFWSEEELRVAGVARDSAADMGHLPIGGSSGSLARIAPLAIPRKVYVHINNTNPILIEDSPERMAVAAAGAEVGWDGCELHL